MPQNQNPPSDPPPGDSTVTPPFLPNNFLTADLKPGDKLDRFTILEVLGAGGFGTVYKAEQRAPIRKIFALKVINLGLNTKEVLARFDSERQTLALMDHPGIARVIDGGVTATGRPYFVMEFVPGKNILTFADENHLSIPERLELFCQVCRAIAHAHTKAVIHRDIKSSNVLASLADGKPLAKVIDFGVAKALTGGHLTDLTLNTGQGQVIGTYDAMSPEQAAGMADIDTRTDVYSLGVLLYELLTGAKPLDWRQIKNQTDHDRRMYIRETDPPRPSTRITTSGELATSIAKARKSTPESLVRELRTELEWIPLKALRKDRSERYDSVAALEADVQRFMDGKPLVAAPDSFAYRSQKFIRRHKTPVLAAAAFAALIVLAVIGYIQVLRSGEAREKAAHQIADQQRDEARQQKQIADAARAHADETSLLARRAALRSEARYLAQQGLLPAALARATEAFNLKGQWEDGYTLYEIAREARRDWRLVSRIPLPLAPELSCVGLEHPPARPPATSPAAQPDPPDEPDTIFICIARDSHLELSIQPYDRSIASFLGTTREGRATHLANVTDARFVTAADFPDKITQLFWMPKIGIIAASDHTIARYSLPKLQRAALRTFPSKIDVLANSLAQLALINDDGIVRVLNLDDLSDLDSFNWKTHPLTKDANIPSQISISPSGRRVLLNGFLWDRTHAAADRPATQPAATTSPMDTRVIPIDLWAMPFIDDDRLLTTYSQLSQGQAEVPAEMTMVALPDTSVLSHPGDKPLTYNVYSQPVPMDDAKGAVIGARAWIGSHGEVDFSLAGESGCLAGTFGAENLDYSTRFANLLPYESEPPQYVASFLQEGLLVLRRGNELLLFKHEPQDINRMAPVYDGCVTSCDLGLLRQNSLPFSIELLPFDPTLPHRFFSTQWLAENPGDPWIRYALGANASASTVVFVAQDDLLGVGAQRVRAVVYRPGNLDQVAGAWPIERTIDLRQLPVHDWSRNRFVDVEPDGNVLAYWDSGALISRYSTRDGRFLGDLDAGPLANRSSDGRYIGAINTQGVCHVYEVATGKTLLQLENRYTTRSLCFSADSKLLILATSDAIESYGLDSGQRTSTTPSHLHPLAWPAAGDVDGRFIAFQADANGNGGDLVLADTADGNPITVLFRSGLSAAPAFFSPTGKEVAIVTNRFSAEVIRSLAPSQVAAAIGDTAERVIVASTRPDLQADPTTRPDLTLDATATDTLAKYIGQDVTIQGTVDTITWTAAHDSILIEFPGPSETRAMIWIPSAAFEQCRQEFGEGFTAVLKGMPITATGKLQRYNSNNVALKQRLEVVLQKPSHLKLPPDFQQRAAVAATQIAAATQLAATPVDAMNLTELKTRVGQDATAQGKVAQVRWVSAHNAINIDFAGPNGPGLMGWIRPAALTKFQTALGDHFMDSLTGATIQISGKVSIYTERVEITLDNPAQLKMITAAPTTAPATQNTK